MFALTVFLCCSGAWFFIHAILNFQGWYGPAGIKSLSALFQGNPSWDEYTYLIHLVHIWTGLDPLLSSYTLSYFGYVTTCLGLSFLAQRWFSIRYSIIPSLILYAPLTMIAQLIGADILCIGLVFLGLGLSARFFPISVLLWSYSAQIKAIALPALTLIPSIFPWTLLALPFLLPFTPPIVEHIPQHAIQLIDKATPLMTVLFLFSLLLSFLQKNKRTRNIIIVLTIFGACTYVSLKLSTKLRPRYLIAPTLPLLIITTGILQKTRIRNIVRCLFWIYLACDSWSFLYHWDQKFVLYEGKTPSFLPPPPFVSSLSISMTDLVHRDHSAKGAQSLQTIGKNIPKGGIVELRDTRHHHLIAVLAQQKKETRIVSPQQCCMPKESLHRCALRIIQEFNQSGGTLILPTTLGQRIKTQRSQWIDLLIHEAQAFPSFKKYDPWWYMMHAQHAQRSMPCTEK